jgi:hypothetical protein
MSVNGILKDVAEFLLVAALYILWAWTLHRRVKERRGPAVQSLFGGRQWWRRRDGTER